MRLERIEGAEISASKQYVVIDGNGLIDLAETFGGRESRSGATYWPEWVQEGAVAIKSHTLLYSEDLAEDRVVCFSGGGLDRVRIYSASLLEVRAALHKWNRWRRFEPLKHDDAEGEQTENMPPMRYRLPRQFDEEPAVSTNAEWIARSISFNELRNAEGTRLTTHEVARYAQALSVKWDPESNARRWTAVMKWWPWEATALEKCGIPEVWTLYQKQETPVGELLEYEEFIEAQDQAE